MSAEAIALAKHLDLSKMEFPAWWSEKLDGVPVRFKISLICGYPVGRTFTRQWEHAISCQEYCNRLIRHNLGKFKEGIEYNFVFEVTHEELTGFKDISGIVRRQTHQPGLVFNLFDFDAFPESAKNSGIGFGERMSSCLQLITLPDGFKTIHQMLYPDAETLQDAIDNTPMEPKQEGWIVRANNALWKPGTRHWDYQKVVKEPTIDLYICGVEEGTGKFAGGVGRFEAEYKGTIIGVGPGKQTTAERNAVLRQWQATPNLRRMASIKYKPDDGYEALRQPTFQHWRDDKETADA